MGVAERRHQALHQSSDVEAALDSLARLLAHAPCLGRLGQDLLQTDGPGGAVVAIMRTRTKLLLARAASRVLLTLRRLTGRGPTATVRRRGLRWDLDLREGIDLSVYLLGGFEVRTARAWRRRIAPGSRVLDVGANVGAHALPLDTWS